jgi:hypothetical protein
VVNKPDAVQTEVRVGHIGIPRKHNDYMALNLAIRILGGEGSNRLHQVLRTDRGLTYSAQANMDAFKEAGDFEAITTTRSGATAQVLRLIVDEFWRLQREPVSEQELAAAKAYMTGSFPLTIETPGAIATQVLAAIFFGLPLSELESYRERVNAVTPEDIQRVAQAYLKPDRLSIVLVGNASAFTGQLRSIGFGQFETVEIDDLDLTSADFKRVPRRGWTPAPPDGGEQPVLRSAGYAVPQSERGRTPDDAAAAKSLLARVISAKGGAAELAAIKTIRAVSSSTMTAPSGRVQAETTTYLAYPDRVRVETKVKQGTLIQAFDGDQAWVRDASGVHSVPDRVLQEMLASLRRDSISALLGADRGHLRTRRLPDIKDAAGSLYHALELSSAQLDPLVLYIDPKTGLIVKQAYVTGDPGRPLIEERFSDYRAVDGIQIAFAAELRRDSRLLVERHVRDFAINPPLEPALFKRPAS